MSKLSLLGFLFLVYLVFIFKKKEFFRSLNFVTIMIYIGVLFIYNPKIGFLLGIPVLLVKFSSFNEEFQSDYEIEDLIKENKKLANENKLNNLVFQTLKNKNKEESTNLNNKLKQKNINFNQIIENTDNKNKVGYQIYDNSFLSETPVNLLNSLNNEEHKLNQKNIHLSNIDQNYNNEIINQKNKLFPNDFMLGKIENNILNIDQNISPNIQKLNDQIINKYKDFETKPPKTYFLLS